MLVTKRWARSWSRCRGSHPADDCHYFSLGLRLPSQPQSITAPWPVPSYTAWWQRHIGVNNLPNVVKYLLPRVGFEPTTCWSQVQRSTRCATAPSWMEAEKGLRYLKGCGSLSNLMTEICEFRCRAVIVHVKWLLSYYFSNVLIYSFYLA